MRKRNPKQLPAIIEKELATSVTVQPEERFTSVKHMANLGDVVSIMPSLKKYWEVTGRKIKILQMVDTPGAYYMNAVHPTLADDGVTQVTMNKKMFSMMATLVESQPYIHSWEAYSGQPIDLDFDVIRGKTFVGMPNLMLQCWIPIAFPDLATDYSKAWIDLPEVKKHPIKKQVEGKIILNFTERYRNELVDYFFLKNYAPDLIFAGTETEHWKFCNRWQLSIPRLEVNDFLEYAYAIKYCRFILGCQSFGWNIAQAIQKPRIVELCRYAPNVQCGVGEDSFGFFYQVGVEYYFRLLYNKTSPNT